MKRINAGIGQVAASAVLAGYILLIGGLGVFPSEEIARAGRVSELCLVQFEISGPPTFEAAPGQTVRVPFTASISVTRIDTAIVSIEIGLPPGIAASYSPTGQVISVPNPGDPATYNVTGSISATVPQSAGPGQSWAFSPNVATLTCESSDLNQPITVSDSDPGFRIVVQPSTATPTDTPTLTPTATATSTATATASATLTPTPSPTATATQPPTATSTPMPTETLTPSATATASPTATATATATATPNFTATLTATVTSTPSQTPAATPTGTASPTMTATASATPTALATSTSAPPETPASDATVSPTSLSRSTATFTAVPAGNSTPTVVQAATALPEVGDTGLILDISEERQSSTSERTNEHSILRAGIGLLGMLALMGGGLGIWLGVRRT